MGRPDRRWQIDHSHRNSNGSHNMTSTTASTAHLYSVPVVREIPPRPVVVGSGW
jgi:hypothetical protein